MTWLAFLIGIFVGFMLGILATCLLVSCGRQERAACPEEVER